MGKRETSKMSRPILLFCSMLLCLALVSAGRSSSSSPPPPPSQPGRCIASSPSNEGDGCATESDCGNSDATKFFCQTTDSYAGRRRRKGGKCITGSPQNAGEDCFNSESDCGNTDPTKFFCQATLAESDTCDDWDPTNVVTKPAQKSAGTHGART